MARRPATAWDTKPHKPIFYGPLARLSDRLAGRKDGRAGLPPLPSTTAPDELSRPAVTPYLDIRDSHFRDRAEREFRHALADLDEAYRTRAELIQRIKGADGQVEDASKDLAAIPEIPDDAFLASRNAVEQHVDEALVRTRRQREHDAKRARVISEYQQAVEAARSLRAQRARLEEAIAARERIRDSRARQLHRHTLRRCGTYKRRLVAFHPDGAALLPFLDLALPSLPEWFGRPGRPADEPGAP